MKLLTTLRALLATCLVAASSITLAAPIPVTPDRVFNAQGILTGANNVTVLGTLYNVTFADGTCQSSFKGGCAQSSFAFNSIIQSQAAAQALLDSVFVDVGFHKLDTVGNSTFGCTDLSECFTLIPYARSSSSVQYSFAYNLYGVNNRNDNVSVAAFDVTVDTNFSSYSAYNLAVFSLADGNAVPEPTSLALLALALAGMTALRCRKS